MNIGHPNANAIPDPEDRTVNDPAVLIESKHVRHFVDNYVKLPTNSAFDLKLAHYIKLAEKKGWTVTRMGAAVLLVANVQLTVDPSTEN